MVFQHDWLYEREFKDWLSGVPGEDYAYCKVCYSDFKCNSISNVRRHADGERHNQLMRDHRRNEREISRNRSSRNRARERSPVTTSYSSRIQVRGRSPMSVASSSRIQIRERSPFSAATFRRSPPQNRRRPQSQREVAMEFFQRNSTIRNEGVGFLESREFAACLTINGIQQASRNIQRRFEY